MFRLPKHSIYWYLSRQNLFALLISPIIFVEFWLWTSWKYATCTVFGERGQLFNVIKSGHVEWRRKGRRLFFGKSRSVLNLVSNRILINLSPTWSLKRKQKSHRNKNLLKCFFEIMKKWRQFHKISILFIFFEKSFSVIVFPFSSFFPKTFSVFFLLKHTKNERIVCFHFVHNTLFFVVIWKASGCEDS